MRIPCPCQYPEPCPGYISRIKISNANITWELAPDAPTRVEWSDLSRFYFFCSEKGDHPQWPRPDGMVFYWHDLPDEFRILLERAGVPSVPLVGQTFPERKQITWEYTSIAIIVRQGDVYAALCPELAVTSEGLSQEESLDNLKDAVCLHLKNLLLKYGNLSELPLSVLKKVPHSTALFDRFNGPHLAPEVIITPVGPVILRKTWHIDFSVDVTL